MSANPDPFAAMVLERYPKLARVYAQQLGLKPAERERKVK